MADSLESLLVRHLSRRDEDAAEQLVRRTRPKLLAAARRIVPAQDAEDVVHTAYLSLFHKGEGFDAPVMPWLVTAVVRIAYRHRARERRQHEIAGRLARPSLAPAAAEGAARAEEHRRLRAGVDRLPAAYRDVLVLHHLEGLSTAEVAGLLGVSQDAVKKRLERGRRLLLGSLAPPVAYPFVFAWWFLADAAEASAIQVGVIAMKSKTATLIVGVAVAAGAAGLGVGGAGGRAARSDARAAAPGEGRARVEELSVEVEAGREREAELRREIDARAPSPTPDTPTPSKYPDVRKAAVRDAALRLSVPEAAMAAALRAEEAIANNSDDMYDLIREVQRFGEGGFRAAIAIACGGAGQPQRKLLDETYQPGLEGLLLDVLESNDADRQTKMAAINTLAKADTPAVRDYLVARIEVEKDRGAFWTLVMTLGRLKEPRAAKAVGRNLLFDDPARDLDWRPMRNGMLHHLSDMGGEDAVHILSDFVADPRAKDPGNLMQALNSLALLDKPRCGEAAVRLLADPKVAALSPDDVLRLRNFARYAVTVR